MRILLDHCVPKRLKRFLSEHEIATAREAGFDKYKNGKLLASAAEEAFDVMITVDQNIRYQQNLTTLPLSITVIVAPSNRFATLAPYIPEVKAVLSTVSSGQYVEVSEPK